MTDFIDPILDNALAMSDEQLRQSLEDDTENESVSQRRFSFIAACAAVSRDKCFLRDTAVTLVLAARDTTAMTLTWCLFELARHPRIVADLRDEIVSKLGADPDQKPTYEDLKDMPLLKHILSETLRLYPSIPYNAREALQDTSLPRGGGDDGTQPVGVKKGTLVYFCPLILRKFQVDSPPTVQWHCTCNLKLTKDVVDLRSDIYPEHDPNFSAPEDFDPYRWDEWRPGPWTYMPFSGGPRTCIGQQFALVEMSYVLVRLFQRYKSLELQGTETDGNGGERDKSAPYWVRHDEHKPELAEAFMRSRPRMSSEITLNPRNEVYVKFLE